MKRAIILVLLIINLFAQSQTEQEKQPVNARSQEENYYIPGGMHVGVYMESEGILVVGIEQVKTSEGEEVCPAQGKIKPGDYILKANGHVVNSKAHLLQIIEENQDKPMELYIRRENKYQNVTLSPVRTWKGEYKAGLWIRNNVQGLGTITYIKADGSFGALGHGIHDMDLDQLIQLRRGYLYKTEVQNIRKGKSQTPGCMEGVIIYNKQNQIGMIEENTKNGVFGQISEIEDLVDETNWVKAMKKSEVRLGKAVIRCMLTEKVEEYEVEIVRLNCRTDGDKKGLEIKIKDERLLKNTGGIIQGMSGSPIIQDGKIIGAVTHVFVNDPTRGYGIFIEEMLEN